MKIVILGGPGAGKGTQAKKISGTYGIPQLSTGDRLREEIRNITGIGKKVKVFVEVGKLAPDEIVIEIVKKELNELRKAFRLWKTNILYINEEISAKAMFYVERHFLSHSLQLADALIAATASVNGLPLLTGNDKHYKVIKELEIKPFRPK